MVVIPGTAGAQEPDQVTGLTATPDVGLTTLSGDRGERAAAHRHVRQDADVHALDDEPLRVTFTLARWGLAPAREGVNVASSVTFAPRLSRVRPAGVTLSVTFDVLVLPRASVRPLARTRSTIRPRPGSLTGSAIRARSLALARAAPDTRRAAASVLGFGVVPGCRAPAVPAPGRGRAGHGGLHPHRAERRVDVVAADGGERDVAVLQRADRGSRVRAGPRPTSRPRVRTRCS